MYENIRIKTERLELRPVEETDLETMYAYASDAEHVKYMLHMPDESLQECKDFLIPSVAEWKKEKPRFYEFAVTLDGHHIGEVSVYGNDDAFLEGELGWVFHRNYCGKGYATEAAQALVQFCRENLPIRKLVAQCDSRNVASQNIMKKLGMTFVNDDTPRNYLKRDEDALETMYVMEI